MARTEGTETIMKFKLIAFLIFVLGQYSPIIVAESIVIENVTLIDGTGRAAVSNSSVHIDGQRISQVIRGHFLQRGKRMMPRSSTAMANT